MSSKLSDVTTRVRSLSLDVATDTMLRQMAVDGKISQFVRQLIIAEFARKELREEMEREKSKA